MKTLTNTALEGRDSFNSVLTGFWYGHLRCIMSRIGERLQGGDAGSQRPPGSSLTGKIAMIMAPPTT